MAGDLKESGVSLKVEGLNSFISDLNRADQSFQSFGASGSKSVSIGNPFANLPGQADQAVGTVQARFGTFNSFVAGVFVGIGAELGKALLGAVESAISAIPNLISTAVGDAASFEQSFNDAFAILQLDADQKKAVVELSLELGANPNLSVGLEEVNQAAGALAIKGVEIEDITNGVLLNTIQLQNALGGSFGDAGALIAKASAQFGIAASDVDTAINSIVGTVREGGLTSIQDYNLALSSVGGVAAGLNIPFSEMNTALAATAKYFSSGSDAGTGLKTFLLSLTPTTKPAIAAMNALGLSFYDAQGNLKPLPNIAQQLNNALEGTITTTAMVGGATEEQNAQIKSLSKTYASITGQIFKYENGISGVNLSEEKRAKKLAELRAALANTGTALDKVTGSTAASTQITKQWQATQEQRIKALKSIFGTDAIRTALGLGDLGEEGFAAIDALIQQTDAAAIAAEKTNTLTGRWKAFTDAIGVTTIKMGAPLLTPLKSVVESMTTLFNLLGAPVLESFGTTLANAITPAAKKFADFAKLVENFFSGFSNSISLSDLFDLGSFDLSLVRDVFGGTKIKLSFGDIFTFVKGGDGTSVKIKDLFTLDTTGEKFVVNVKDFIKFTNSKGKTTFNIGDFFSFESNRAEDRTVVDLGKLITFTNSKGTTFFNIGDYFSFRKDVKKTNVDLGKLIKFTNSKGQSRFSIGDFFTFDRNVNKTQVDLGKLISFTNSKGQSRFSIGDFFTFDRNVNKTTVDLGNLISFTNSKGTTHFNIGDFFTFDSDEDKTTVDLSSLIQFTNSKGRTTFNIGDYFQFNRNADKTTVDLGTLINFTNSRGKTTFNIGDFFKFNRNTDKTTVDIGSLISFTNSKGRTAFNIGDFFQFNRNAEKTKVDIGSLIEFTNSKGQTTFRIGDFFSFDSSSIDKVQVNPANFIEFVKSGAKRIFSLKDFFGFDASTIDRIRVDLSKLVSIGGSISPSGIFTLSVNESNFSLDLSGVKAFVSGIPGKISEAITSAFGSPADVVPNVTSFVAKINESLKEAFSAIGLDVNLQSIAAGLDALAVSAGVLAVAGTGVGAGAVLAAGGLSLLWDAAILFNTIDAGKFKEIGQNVSDAAKSILDFGTTLVSSLNPTALGKQFTDLITGFVDRESEFLSGLDTTGLSSSFSSFITSAIEKVSELVASLDTTSLANAFLGLASAGLNKVSELISGLDTSGLTNGVVSLITTSISKLSETISGLDTGTLATSFVGFVQSGIGKLSEVFSTLDASSLTSSFVGFIQSAVSKLSETLSDPALGQSISDGVSTLIKAITGNEGLVQLGTGAVTLGLGIAAISTAVSAFPVAGLLGIAGAFTAVGSVITYVNTLDISTLKSIGTDIGNAATAILDFGTSLVDSFDAEAFASTASDFVTGFVDRISATISGVDTGAISDSALTFVTSILNKLSSVFGDSTLGADIGASAGKLVGTLVQKLTDTLSNPQAFADLGSGVGNITLAIGTFVTQLVTSFATEIGKVDFGALAASGALSFTAFVQGIGTEFGKALSSAIETNLPSATAAFQSFIDSIVNAINSLPLVGSLVETSSERQAAQDAANAAVVTGANSASPGTFTQPVSIQEATQGLESRMKAQIDNANLSVEELAAQQTATGESSKSFLESIQTFAVQAALFTANLATTVGANSAVSLPAQGPAPLAVAQAPTSGLGAVLESLIPALAGSQQPVAPVLVPSGESQVTFDPLVAAAADLSQSAGKLAGAFPAASAAGQTSPVATASGEPQVTFDPVVAAAADLKASATTLASAFPAASAANQRSPTSAAQPVGGGTGFLAPSFTQPIPVVISGATPSAGGSSLFGAQQQQQKEPAQAKAQTAKLPAIKLPSFAPLATAISAFSAKLLASVPKPLSFAPLTSAISFAAGRLRDVQSPPSYSPLFSAISSASSKLNAIITLNLTPLSTAASGATARLNAIQTVNMSGLLNAVSSATSKLGSIQPVNFGNLLNAAARAATNLASIQPVNFTNLSNAVGRATGVLNDISGDIDFSNLQSAAGRVTGIFNDVPRFPGWPNCPCPPVTCGGSNANASDANAAAANALEASVTLSSSIVSAATAAQQAITSEIAKVSVPSATLIPVTQVGEKTTRQATPTVIAQVPELRLPSRFDTLVTLLTSFVAKPPEQTKPVAPTVIAQVPEIRLPNAITTLLASFSHVADLAQRTIVDAPRISSYQTDNSSNKVSKILSTPPQVTNNYYNSNRYYQLTVNAIDSSASVLQQFAYMEHVAAAL